jgi:hypothetical protein
LDSFLSWFICDFVFLERENFFWVWISKNYQSFNIDWMKKEVASLVILYLFFAYHQARQVNQKEYNLKISYCTRVINNEDRKEYKNFILYVIRSLISSYLGLIDSDQQWRSQRIKVSYCTQLVHSCQSPCLDQSIGLDRVWSTMKITHH